MSEVFSEPVVPRGGVFAAAALVLFALAAVITVRLTGVGEIRMTLPAAVESRDLRFEDGKGGAVLVYDAKDRELIDTLAPGSNGFIRVVLRGLARERKQGDFFMLSSLFAATQPAVEVVQGLLGDKVEVLPIQFA